MNRATFNLQLCVFVALVLGAAQLNCSAVGYGLGCAAGAISREGVSPAELRSMDIGQYTWVILDSGERVHGRLATLPAADSIGIALAHPTSDPGDHLRTTSMAVLPTARIASAQVPRRSLRWLGLGFGAAIDAAVIHYALTVDHSFQPDQLRMWTQ